MCILNRVFSKDFEKKIREEGDNSSFLEDVSPLLDFENSGGIITDNEYEIASEFIFDEDDSYDEKKD